MVSPETLIGTEQCLTSYACSCAVKHVTGKKHRYLVPPICLKTGDFLNKGVLQTHFFSIVYILCEHAAKLRILSDISQIFCNIVGLIVGGGGGLGFCPCGANRGGGHLFPRRCLGLWAGWPFRLYT